MILQVIQSWYVMGRLGAFNSSNLQVCSHCSVSYFLNYCVVFVLFDDLRFEYRFFFFLRKRNISHTFLFGRVCTVEFVLIIAG